ncbi:MAG: FAD-dependent oxidoreductase, partial [bacterium]
MSEQADAVVIGGGFYGCAIALYLKTHHHFNKIVLLEQGDD